MSVILLAPLLEELWTLVSSGTQLDLALFVALPDESLLCTSANKGRESVVLHQPDERE